jgi:DNA-directed RNA polymerase subunit E'/Rpb7
MYLKINRKDVIRIPPERLGEDLNELSQELTQHSFEGKIVGDRSLIVMTANIKAVFTRMLNMTLSFSDWISRK